MNTTFNRRQTVKYLLFTFIAAYIVQFAAAPVYKKNLALGQTLLAAMMFVPMLGVLFSGAKLKGMGWNPIRKGNLLPILTAWFSPLLLTALGAGLYFLVFPQHFDLSGANLVEIAGEEALQQMEAAGISYPLYVLISVVSSVTYAPLINTILGLGEEVGWRGFLYPQLKARFGRKTGWLLGGVIWGLWHAPMIALVGYEYGSEYIGFPVVGILLFCVTTVALGILEDWLYEKTNCIWLPALFHGAFNAAATIPLGICVTHTGSARLLGAAPNGLLAGIPLFVFTLIIIIKTKDKEGSA